MAKTGQGECLLYRAKPNYISWAFCIDVITDEKRSLRPYGDAEVLSLSYTSAYLSNENPFTVEDCLQIGQDTDFTPVIFDNYRVFRYSNILELIDDLPVTIVIPNSELIRRLIEIAHPRLSG